MSHRTSYYVVHTPIVVMLISFRYISLQGFSRFAIAHDLRDHDPSLQHGRSGRPMRNDDGVQKIRQRWHFTYRNL